MSLSQEERMARRKRNRMAGDALNEDTSASEAASDAVATSEQNKSLADRFGQDYVDSVKVDGRQDGNKYSRKELAAEFRYGRGDTSVDDTVAKFQGMVDSGKFKGNNKAQGFLEMHGVNFGNDDASVPTPTPEPEIDAPEIAPPSNGGGGEGPTQTIQPPGLMPGIPTGGGMGINFQQTQDNDQNITNNGSNNVNNQTMDNSNDIVQQGAAGFSKDWMNKYFNPFGA